MSRSETNRKASELYNSMSFEDRHKAGLGYSLAQLSTISQQRQANKEMITKEDKRLSDWYKNIEQHIVREYLAPPTLNKRG